MLVIFFQKLTLLGINGSLLILHSEIIPVPLSRISPVKRPSSSNQHAGTQSQRLEMRLIALSSAPLCVDQVEMYLPLGTAKDTPGDRHKYILVRSHGLGMTSKTRLRAMSVRIEQAVALCGWDTELSLQRHLYRWPNGAAYLATVIFE